jgi:hypothetical protein
VIKSCGAARKVIAPLAQRCTSRLKALISKDGAAASAHPQKAPPITLLSHHTPEPPALPASSAMRVIKDGRAGLLDQLGWSAQQGVVGDGIVRRLLANHEAELAEHQRLLTQDGLTMETLELRLSALFPPLPEPEPEPAPPPAPRRQRVYPVLGDMLSDRPKSRPH